MIVEYDNSGRITHVIHDPVPSHMAKFMREERKTFLNLPPVPWPKELTADVDGNVSMQSNGYDSVPCDIMSDYVKDGKLSRRPDCPAVVTSERMTLRITELPNGSKVSLIFDGASIDIDETEVEFDEPGSIRVKISPPWPYLEATHDVEIK